MDNGLFLYLCCPVSIFSVTSADLPSGSGRLPFSAMISGMFFSFFLSCVYLPELLAEKHKMGMPEKDGKK
jgi:hypothetical protein